MLPMTQWKKTTPNSWLFGVTLDFYTSAWEVRGRRVKKSAGENSLSFLEQKPRGFLLNDPKHGGLSANKRN